jgi:hypothetical protein
MSDKAADMNPEVRGEQKETVRTEPTADDTSRALFAEVASIVSAGQGFAATTRLMMALETAQPEKTAAAGAKDREVRNADDLIDGSTAALPVAGHNAPVDLGFRRDFVSRFSRVNTTDVKKRTDK